MITNATEYARVHVIATRYHPAFDIFASMATVRDSEPYQFRIGKTLSAYVTGRDIGDEYRYIIDRKYAKKFPGNMLERPGRLLNPWALVATETAVGVGGGAGGRFRGRRGGRAARW